MNPKRNEQYDGFYLREEDGPYGKSMVLNEPWRTEFCAFMDKNQIQWLRLSRSAGWRGENIDFVSGLKNLKVFEIYNWDVKNPTPIQSLVDLERISLSCNLKTAVDFTHFRNLSDCYIHWSKKAESILQCERLKRLNMVKYPFEDITPLGHLQELEILQLTSHKLKTLDGIQAFKNLKVLDLYMCVKLEDLTGIETLAELEKIEVESCKKIHEISKIAGLNRLLRVSLTNCGKIKSVEPLRHCKSLKDLTFVAETVVEDGNMGFMLEMPALERTLYAERRHYSHKNDDIQEALDRRKKTT